MLSDQSVDDDVAGLADSVASVLGLLVHGWVPVGVVKDYVTGAGQVQTDTARSCAADET